MKSYVLKGFIDYEKEERWLNEMSAKGLALNGYFFFLYSFTDCEPGEYIYRIELLENLPGNPESRKYIDFLSENGVEHIASWARWVYFRKQAKDGPFDIYSDIDSKLTHFKRISTLWLVLMIMMAAFSIQHFIHGMDYFHSGYESGAIASFVFCIIMLCLFVFLFVAWNSLRLRTRKLKKEKLLHE
jgi:hypothetical protein